MASKADAPSAQSKTFQVLSQIDGQFCNDEVVVRLIHFWEARNFKKGNILMGLELLLLDAEPRFLRSKRFLKMQRTGSGGSLLGCGLQRTSKGNGLVTANIVESLNSWIAEASGLPIIQMMECIRRQLMTWFNERRETSMQWTSILVPTAEWRVAEAFEIARTYQTWFLAAFDSRENK
ncbi:unnamed protein product [Microthlaspi erraticum]|uniref:Uncharacterized protein n=1 Tax=Microthlaspi erraticum TaxID=1685480 RepID=A0A6D2HLG2_9BRAS|nr:unnamed protein product [Microthlaspi erraticum]